MKKVQREIFYVFSPFLRVFHWIMVASIIILFVTGLLITKPAGILATEPTATSMSVDLIRNIHFTVAYIFLAAFISGGDISTHRRLMWLCTICSFVTSMLRI